MDILKQLCELRKSLPKGKKDPFGTCCVSKRVLLNRALKRQSVKELTHGELAVVNEFVEYYRGIQQVSKDLEKQIINIIRK
ncbi:MAG: hypothetical protein NC229_01595 [Bacteroides sp.]|nr:hypothetical protein [Bacteroidales bacterium]MCM1068692.1 hypothetical protein [Prevotella sp.]MCM1353356.1 hypothetical protein [Bacteroides sp.]MCM1402789.1 hypothetical protein [Bacteroides sp.]MCM1442236.1 hypothetical protein [Muribaculum sp.]